ASARSCSGSAPRENVRVQSPHQPSGDTGWRSTWPSATRRFSVGGWSGKQIVERASKPTFVIDQTSSQPRCRSHPSTRSRSSISVIPGSAVVAARSATSIAIRWTATSPSGTSGNDDNAVLPEPDEVLDLRRDAVEADVRLDRPAAPHRSLVARIDESGHRAAAAQVVADVAEQVEQLVAVRIEETARDGEELVRRHPGLAGVENRPLDPPRVGEDALAARVIADDDGARHIAGPAAEVGRDVEPDEVRIVDGAVGRRERRMADERARPRADGDRRPDAGRAALPRDPVRLRGV